MHTLLSDPCSRYGLRSNETSCCCCRPSRRNWRQGDDRCAPHCVHAWLCHHCPPLNAVPTPQLACIAHLFLQRQRLYINCAIMRFSSASVLSMQAPWVPQARPGPTARRAPAAHLAPLVCAASHDAFSKAGVGRIPSCCTRLCLALLCLSVGCRDAALIPSNHVICRSSRAPRSNRPPR